MSSGVISSNAMVKSELVYKDFQISVSPVLVSPYRNDFNITPNEEINSEKPLREKAHDFFV